MDDDLKSILILLFVLPPLGMIGIAILAALWAALMVFHCSIIFGVECLLQKVFKKLKGCI